MFVTSLNHKRLLQYFFPLSWLGLSSFVRKLCFPKCNDSAFEKVEGRDLPDWYPQMGYLLLWHQLHFPCYLLQAASFLIHLRSSFCMWSISTLWGLSIIAVYLVVCVRKQEFKKKKSFSPVGCYSGCSEMRQGEEKGCVIPLIDMADRLSSFFYPVRKM